MLASMRRVALVFVLVLCGCGAATTEERSASSTLPATDRDPLPFTPAPEADGRTDRTVSLAASGGEDQARQMLPVLLRAIRDADQHQLEQLFADEVIQVQGQGERTQVRPRALVLERILAYARRTIIQPDVEVDEMVDLPNVQVSRAAQFWQGREMPPGVRATDLVVQAPLLDAGRAPLRAVLMWHLTGHMVVRPGRDPRIVAL